MFVTIRATPILLILMILSFLWMGSQLMLLVGMGILHKRFVLLVFTAAHNSLTADLVAFSW